MSKSTEVLIVHESVLASYLKDIGTVGSLSVVVWFGVALDSDALQWVAGVAWIFAVISMAMRSVDGKRLTVETARKRLDEIEAGLR